MEQVTIFSASHAHQADIIAALLGSHNIDTFIKDKFSSQVFGLSSTDLGGYQILVASPLAEKAISILKEHNIITNEDFGSGDLIRKDLFDKVPIINKLPGQFRLLAIGFIVLSLLFTLVLAIG